jgi:tetratricopeptide (TPR) repeat protein
VWVVSHLEYIMNTAWRSTGTRAVFILLLTIVAYLPVMRAGFIWDDDVLITENPMTKARDGLYRSWLTTEAMDYYPMTWTLFWSEWRLWGNNPMGYHVLNVLLHAANVVLIWVLLRRLKIPGAWLAALVFGIHPVNVATVAWVSEQKNTLSMLFYLIAILLYLRFDENGSWRWYVASLSAFVVALFSKTAVAMLPVVLLGCMWWMHGRVQRKDVLRSVPFFAASVVMSLVIIWFEFHRDMQGHPVRTVGFAYRLAAAGWVPWFYLGKALLPVNLSVIYPKWQIDASQWAFYLPGVILIVMLTVFWWKRDNWGRALFFGVGYFTATLLPVMGFVDQAFYRYSLVADHWQYYSIVGIIALAVAGAARLCLGLVGPGRSVAMVVCVVLLGLLAARTWERGRIYTSEETLWQDTLARNPSAWIAQNNLGLIFWRTGRREDAIACLRQTVRFEPDFAEGHNNLGNALAQTGQLPAAVEEYEQALRLDPNLAEADYNLANILSRTRRLPEAIAYYEQAVRLKPDYAEAHYHLGIALERSNKREEARSEYEGALRLKPDYREAQDRLKQLETGR